MLLRQADTTILCAIRNVRITFADTSAPSKTPDEDDWSQIPQRFLTTGAERALQ
jgi:hypothetical protein